MFQYTNTILVNSATDLGSGTPKWSGQAEDLVANPPIPGSFNYKRVNKFIKDNVVDSIIYKREGRLPEYSTVTFDLSTITEPGLYRVALYLRYGQGNRNSFYSNDMTFHGKPIWIEFRVNEGDTPATIAQTIVSNWQKYKVILDNKVLDVTTTGTTITFTAKDEFVRFIARPDSISNQNYAAAIEHYENKPSDCDCNDDCNCLYIPIIIARHEDETGYDGDNVIVEGREGFGTWYQITKDLRLPTMEARRFTALNEEELPIPGALYNQYTLHYVKRRGVLGTNAVGDLVTSGTTHVFFVRQDLATAFETAIANIGTVTDVEDPN